MKFVGAIPQSLIGVGGRYGCTIRKYQSSHQLPTPSQQIFEEEDFQNWLYDYDPKSESRLKPWKDQVVV